MEISSLLLAPTALFTRGMALPARATGAAWVARTHPAAPVDDRPRVLIADDDRATVQVLRHRLERDGLSVRTVTDGAAALDALASDPPHAALLNVNLSGVDGFEIVRRIRAGEAGPAALRLALMCWDGNDGLVVRGFALGADDLIVRPFSLAEASARVRRLTRTPHAR